MIKSLITILFGIWAGLVAYSIYYSSSSVLNAIIILGFLSLFFYATRTWQVLWNNIGLLQQPYIIALLFIFGAYYHFSMEGFGFLPSSAFALGLTLIGFALGTIVYTYWNIA